MLNVVRMPSLASALRARLRRFKFVPDEFVSTTPARSSVATSPPGADLNSRQAGPKGEGQDARSYASDAAPLNHLAANAGEICGLDGHKDLDMQVALAGHSSANSGVAAINAGTRVRSAGV